MSPEQKPAVSPRLSSILLLMLCGIFVVAQVYLLIPMEALIQHQYAVSPDDAAWVISAFGFAYALGFLTLGPLSDCFSRKKFIVFGLVILSVITFFLGVVHSYDALIFLRVLQGFAASIFAPTAMAYMGMIGEESRRVLGLSLLIMAFALSGILGQVYAVYVMLFLGWPWLFWGMALAYVVVAFFIFWRLEENGKARSKSDFSLALYTRMIQHIKNARLVPLYFTTFIILMSFVSVYSVLGGYLGHKFGLASDKIVYIRMAGIPSMCLSPWAGSMARRFGGNRVAMVGLCILMLGLCFEAMAGSLGFFVFSSAFFDAGVAVTTPGIVVMINKVVTQAKGSAMSLYTFFLFVGAGLGPIVSERLYVYGFKTVCFSFVGLFALCFFMLLLAQNRVNKHLNTAA
jgi:MFS transporter, YNFM family, putative membrane transport protein